MRCLIGLVALIAMCGHAAAQYSDTDALAVKGLLLSSVGDWKTSQTRLKVPAAYILAKDFNGGHATKTDVDYMLVCLEMTENLKMKVTDAASACVLPTQTKRKK